MVHPTTQALTTNEGVSLDMVVEFCAEPSYTKVFWMSDERVYIPGSESRDGVQALTIEVTYVGQNGQYHVIKTSLSLVPLIATHVRFGQFFIIHCLQFRDAALSHIQMLFAFWRLSRVTWSSIFHILFFHYFFSFFIYFTCHKSAHSSCATFLLSFATFFFYFTWDRMKFLFIIFIIEI